MSDTETHTLTEAEVARIHSPTPEQAAEMAAVITSGGNGTDLAPLPPPVEPELPPGGHSYRRAEAYEEIPQGDGVMRVEVGHYVVTQADGSVAVHPPEIFAALYPHDA